MRLAIIWLSVVYIAGSSALPCDSIAVFLYRVDSELKIGSSARQRYVLLDCIIEYLVGDVAVKIHREH